MQLFPRGSLLHAYRRSVINYLKEGALKLIGLDETVRLSFTILRRFIRVDGAGIGRD